MKQLENREELELLLSQESPVILQFGSDTCGPCHAIRQRIDRWNREHSQVQTLYIPIEKYRALAAQWEIYSVPSLIVMIEGKVTVRQSGVFSLDQILDQTERLLKLREEELI